MNIAVLYIKLCHGFLLLSNYAVQVVVLGWHCQKLPGLGTAFFYVLNASFFCVLLKHTMFFCILFLRTFKNAKNTKNAKNATFFCKEHKRTQRTQRSFAKNVKECNVLSQKSAKECRMLRSFEKSACPTLVLFFNIYIYRYIYRYI